MFTCLYCSGVVYWLWVFFLLFLYIYTTNLHVAIYSVLYYAHVFHVHVHDYMYMLYTHTLLQMSSIKKSMPLNIKKVVRRSMSMMMSRKNTELYRVLLELSQVYWSILEPTWGILEYPRISKSINSFVIYNSCVFQQCK